MSLQSLERNFQDLQHRVLPVRMDLFETHPISYEEQARMIDQHATTFQADQNEVLSGMKIQKRLAELQRSLPFTSNRALAATRVSATYIGLHLVSEAYKKDLTARKKGRDDEFCFYTDAGWAEYQIAHNIFMARRTGDPSQTLRQIERNVKEGQKLVGSPPMDPELAQALVSLRLTMAYGQTLMLLDEDPTGKKLIDHYVTAMQAPETAIKELNMHPAQGIRYVALGGDMFKAAFGKLYPVALSLTPRPELKFS